jgi:hypothetical protein
MTLNAARAEVSFMSLNTARIEIVEPKLFKTGAVLIVTAFGLLAIIPVFISFLVVSLMRVGIPTLLIPLGALAVTAYFLPFAFGNAYVTRLVRGLNPEFDGFIVQLTLSPRLRSDIRALAEDADDVGFLTVNDTGFLFHGDSVKLSVPFDQIKAVRRKNIGLRGLFVYGSRLVVTVPGLANIKTLEFGERSSRLLPASRKTTLKLYELLSAGVAKANPAAH